MVALRSTSYALLDLVTLRVITEHIVTAIVMQTVCILNYVVLDILLGRTIIQRILECNTIANSFHTFCAPWRCPSALSAR